MLPRQAARPVLESFCTARIWYAGYEAGQVRAPDKTVVLIPEHRCGKIAALLETERS